MHSPDTAVESDRVVGFASRGEGNLAQTELKRRRSRDLVDDKLDAISENSNNNNSSKRHLHSPTYSTRVKTPRLSADYPSERSGVGHHSKADKRQGPFDLSLFDVANWQRQAMQLAFLHQHHASSLKQHESQQSGGSPSSPDDDSSSSAINKNAMAMAMAAGGLPAHHGLLPQQMQQLLTQQVLSPQQLQAFMQQQAMTAHQQAQIQEFYRQQQKQIQDFQIQLAAAKQQQKQASNASRSDGDTMSGKMNKQDQHQMQQQLALQQLMHLQQIQQQQQQQQQQQAAAAALQQQGLAAAVALAQSQRHQHQLGQDMSPAEIQNLLLKHVAENVTSSRKEEASTVPLPGNGVTEKSYSTTAKNRERNEDRRESVNGDFADNERRSSNARGSRESTPESRTQTSAQTLFAHGVCKWPGCDVECADVSAFARHLNSCHRLDDKSTAQCRVQMQVVEQLEKQANQERERLEAMMAHLHMDGRDGRTESRDSVGAEHYASMSGKSEAARSNGNSSSGGQVNNNMSGGSGSTGIQHSMALGYPVPSAATGSISSRVSNPLSLPSSPISSQHLSVFPTSLFPATSSVPSSPPLFAPSINNQSLSNGSRDTSSMLQPTKRRHSAGVPISADLTQNQEFYRTADVRPPFTYASLIRQAIIEAPDHQMTLNEIYNWFQKKFAYFRRNAPTWKSAIRTNLSLHKCFKRCEDVMGSYWTVDDREFRKGRHLKRGRPRKYNERDAAALSRAQSPAVRGRMEVNNNQGFYGNPMNLAAMQMTFGDAAQLASQAMFGTNPMSNYNSFMPGAFGGVSHSLSSDASMAMDPAEAVSNLSSLMGARRQSVSPVSNHSYKEDGPGRDGHIGNIQNSVKMELMDESQQQRVHNDRRSTEKLPMYNIKTNGSPQHEDGKMFNSPAARGSRDDDLEERGSGGSTLSDTSAGDEVDKPLNLHHAESADNGSSLARSILSARGSFTMLHDQSAAE